MNRLLILAGTGRQRLSGYSEVSVIPCSAWLRGRKLAISEARGEHQRRSLLLQHLFNISQNITLAAIWLKLHVIYSTELRLKGNAQRLLSYTVI